MDLTLANAVVTSGTTVLTTITGSIFSFLVTQLPTIFALAAVGFVFGAVRWVVRKISHPHGR